MLSDHKFNKNESLILLNNIYAFSVTGLNSFQNFVLEDMEEKEVNLHLLLLSFEHIVSNIDLYNSILESILINNTLEAFMYIKYCLYITFLYEYDRFSINKDIFLANNISTGFLISRILHLADMFGLTTDEKSLLHVLMDNTIKKNVFERE